MEAVEGGGEEMDADSVLLPMRSGDSAKPSTQILFSSFIVTLAPQVWIPHAHPLQQRQASRALFAFAACGVLGPA